MNVRNRVILAVACLAAAIVAPWLLVIQPKRDQASTLQSQINSKQAELTSVRSQLAAGNAARAAFASSYTALVRLGEAVPTDDDTPSLIYQIQAAAQAADVDFQSLALGTSAGSAPSSSAPSSSSPSSSSPSSSGTSKASSATTLPPGVTIGPAGFPVQPFNFTFVGNFFHLADFVGRLQRFVVARNKALAVSGRLMTLNSISLGANAAATGQSGQLTATVAATTYLLPASQGLLDGATAAGPGASTTQTVSSSAPSSSPPPAVVTASPVR